MLFKTDKIQEAIEFIKTHEPVQGYDVKFSGGKDSIVLYDLVKKANVKHTVHYNWTTIDPPELLKFIRSEYPEVEWIKPKHNFYQYLLKFGLPTKQRRWCCAKLKHRVGSRKTSKHKLVGVRAEESPKRASRDRVFTSKWQNDIAYAPLLYFTEADIWDYIESHNLKYPSLYDEGFSRLGCVICPFICRNGILQQHKSRWSRMYQYFEKTVERLYAQKREYYVSQGIMSHSELLDCWYVSKSVILEDITQLSLF